MVLLTCSLEQIAYIIITRNPNSQQKNQSPYTIMTTTDIYFKSLHLSAGSCVKG